MKKSILLILMRNRTGTAVSIQAVLTEMGCFIKTRLGIHDVSTDECTNTGLVILELIGTDNQKKDLVRKIKTVKDVKVKLVEMSL